MVRISHCQGCWIKNYKSMFPFIADKPNCFKGCFSRDSSSMHKHTIEWGTIFDLKNICLGFTFGETFKLYKYLPLTLWDPN